MPGAVPAGYRHRAFDRLPSTSSEALAAARRGDDGRLWITAAVQTAGRGRRGRSWSTEPGNLAASLLLIDPAPPAVAPTLSFVAALALRDAILARGGAGLSDRLRLKWPNDVLLDDRKVAGILVEGENFSPGRMAVVVGIGVNCASHPAIGGAIAATDLAARGVAIGAEGLFVALAMHMAERIAMWDGGAGFAAIRAEWLRHAVGVGQTIRVNLADRSAEGRFDALDDMGRLILTRSDGRREAFSAGDVFLGSADGLVSAT
jgi:BirA family biotin operon repressor/biotin-[acetyl-CoA-carboxylase] ligase